MRIPFPLVLGALIACSDTSAPPPPPPPPPPAGAATLQGLGTFTSPVFVTSPPAPVDSGRLFVVEREGRVRLLRRDTLAARAFLDLRGKISAVSENGLFSLAFHPQYQANGRFYVFFTNLNGDIRVVRYLVSANPDSADEAAADTILAVPHPLAGTTLPFGNHHGGQLQFGPDGKLYVSLGDGGCCGDPLGNGQRKHTLNGKLLRLDVDGATGYVVPPDNPFVGDTSYAPEIWALGLRNPWRFSFDKETGDLYIGDVGDGSWEEVDVAPAGAGGGGGGGGGKGANYGWNTMEGKHCYTGASCNQAGLVLPLVEYPHTEGCSVTGGYVYRGTRVAALAGQYLFADYCSGFVRGLLGDGSWRNLTTQLSPGTAIVSFGEDARGDVYIVTLTGGVYRIVPAGG
jgi:glucose/arabinose dehydrogenase